MTMTHIKSFAVSLAAGTLALPVDTLVQIPLIYANSVVVKMPSGYPYQFGDASVAIPANFWEVDSFAMPTDWVGVPCGASHVIIRNIGNAASQYITFASEI